VIYKLTKKIDYFCKNEKTSQAYEITKNWQEKVANLQNIMGWTNPTYLKKIGLQHWT
jgi:hypothetical protein